MSLAITTSMDTNYATTKVSIGSSLPLTGIGYETIIDPVDGSIIARLLDGNFLSVTTPLSQAMEGPTLILEAA